MKTRDRRAVMLGGGALALIAVAWFLALPWWADWAEARQRIELSQQRLEELHDQIRRLVALDGQLEPVMGAAVKKPLDDLQNARTRIIKDLMDLYAQSGVQIRTVQSVAGRPVPQLPGVIRPAVQVQATCQPLQLVQILAAARKSPSLLLIDHMEVASASQGPGAMDLTIVWSTLARQEASP